ncbi:MAG: hypothetical protein A3A33_03355 [Candidatus Yanofskybacteria bacterium RIFCSPLOWO2_01_FULL_49_25]|uniref:Uncharacterized protein n=1 Tax=Candidatus Yanofskybacteria bacterium RIFCSPLOWO2_01_FULL_49_25 TaxID=1802701 RepID=A0A1F8GU20_9BACT|nr:MAG: hypothetical protein A3A33_03355 [Candidatus Yanofskybacteria bacterium RIFCSPLOWO2_01_FULL_49_25]
MKLKSSKNQEGVAIIYVVLMVGVLLSIVFALSAIFLPKVRTATDVKNSVGALYAAESALEWCLYIAYIDPIPPIPPPVMDNEATYAKQDGTPLIADDCALPTIQINGTYRSVTRAFQITP